MADEMTNLDTAAAGKAAAKDDRRDAIVSIAKEVFLESGYAGASMSQIAARVGGSKGTLYSYFKSKEELFVAVIERKCHSIASLLRQAAIESGGDVRATLTNFAEHFLELVMSDDAIATHRLVTAEAARFPEIGAALYNSIRQTQGRMAEFLEQAKAMGQLRADTDISVAVDQFFGLCLRDIQQRRLWNVTAEPTAKEIRAQATNAVSTFMRAFGSEPQRH